MFREYASSIAPRLRLQQLVDLARAYELKINQNATKKQLLPIIIAAEEQGVFNQPPKNLWYWEKAKWNADQLKEAKIKGFAIGPLMRWTGPNPDPEPEYEPGAARRAANKANTQKGIIGQLRTQAKELGINSFAKGREQLAREIAEKRGEIAPSEAA